MNLEDLLGSLAGVPHLPGAICRQDPELWDDTDDPEPAIQGCLHQCPALAKCRDWSSTMSDISGVVAGVVHIHPTGRKGRKAGAA